MNKIICTSTTAYPIALICAVHRLISFWRNYKAVVFLHVINYRASRERYIFGMINLWSVFFKDLWSFCFLRRFYTSVVQMNLREECGRCRAMKTKGMVFGYTWVYSKEDTMAHTRRPVVTS